MIKTNMGFHHHWLQSFSQYISSTMFHFLEGLSYPLYYILIVTSSSPLFIMKVILSSTKSNVAFVLHADFPSHHEEAGWTWPDCVH